MTKYIPFEGDYVKLPDGRTGVVGTLSKANRDDGTVTATFKRQPPVVVSITEIVAAWDCVVGPAGKPTFPRQAKDGP